MLYQKYFKTYLDTILALLLIVLFLPLFVIAAIAVYVGVGTPLVFQQVRPGKNEKLFTIYKFRTMNNLRDRKGNLLPDDARLTPIGMFLRKLSLDELPQLFNVLKGEMSFIGPRPLLEEYLPLYTAQQRRRHEVKPGITGWAQVNGRNAISWEEKFALDVWYVEHISFGLDIKILWHTLWKVLYRRDVSSKRSLTMEKFEGSNNNG